MKLSSSIAAFLQVLQTTFAQLKDFPIDIIVIVALSVTIISVIFFRSRRNSAQRVATKTLEHKKADQRIIKDNAKDNGDNVGVAKYTRRINALEVERDSVIASRTVESDENAKLRSTKRKLQAQLTGKCEELHEIEESRAAYAATVVSLKPEVADKEKQLATEKEKKEKQKQTHSAELAEKQAELDAIRRDKAQLQMIWQLESLARGEGAIED